MKHSLRFAVAAALLAGSALAQAQAWPTKPVKIVVPYPPGGAVDVVTRKMAAKLQEQTGQTEVPTFNEAGVKFFGLINFTGLWAPKGTPRAVIDRLQKEIGSERTAYWGKVAANTAFERQ